MWFVVKFFTKRLIFLDSWSIMHPIQFTTDAANYTNAIILNYIPTSATTSTTDSATVVN